MPHPRWSWVGLVVPKGLTDMYVVLEQRDHVIHSAYFAINKNEVARVTHMTFHSMIDDDEYLADAMWHLGGKMLASHEINEPYLSLYNGSAYDLIDEEGNGVVVRRMHSH